MKRFLSFLIIAGCGILASAAEPSRIDESEELRFFETRIRPLLAAHCWSCHGPEEANGGLRLDSGAFIRAGGDSGPVLQPGEADDSLLLSAVAYEDLEMPPDEPLSDGEIKDLRRWIEHGAYWPPEGEAVAEPDGSADESWWAAEPLQFSVPEAAFNEAPVSAAATPVDRFIRERLAEHELTPAPRADRRTLLRRLYYDVLGVPPSPDEVASFVADDAPDAYRRRVDAVLASPHYGERWGRHWLDLTRYAESDGWRQDAYRPNAWRYRDWVIDALNSDLSYSDFVAYQLAGDEIAPHDPNALAAAGFLRLGIYEYNQRDAEDQWQAILSEMADVTADVFLATGMACAKCHDHKFDPIPRSDYFRLLACFEPVLWTDVKARSATADPELEQLKAERAALEAESRRQLADPAVEKFPVAVQEMYRKDPDQRNSYEHQIAYLVYRQVEWEWEKLEETLKKNLSEEEFQRWQQLGAEIERRSGEEPATIMTVVDASGPTRPTRLPGRSTGRSFAPGIPQVFGGDNLNAAPPTESPTSTGRRLALARWIADPANPIAARVIVNRLWQHHFGTGVVASANDFGRLGVPPTHPQLLDYLAAELARKGGSLKSIHRTILLSDVYCQSARHPDHQVSSRKDPQNQWLWHYPLRRLDAEQFRDSLLVVAGSMDWQMGGPSPSGTPSRRSVYLRQLRNAPDEMLQLMDAPPSLVSVAQRSVTTTATQSLMMLNSNRTLEMSRRFAERVRRDADADDPASFIKRAYEIATGTPPPTECYGKADPAPRRWSGSAA